MRNKLKTSVSLILTLTMLTTLCACGANKTADVQKEEISIETIQPETTTTEKRTEETTETVAAEDAAETETTIVIEEATTIQTDETSTNASSDEQVDFTSQYTDAWDTMYVILDGLNFRTGPGDEYTIIHTWSFNEAVTVTGWSSNGWARIQDSDGTIGYSADEYLSSEYYVVPSSNDYDNNDYDTYENSDTYDDFSYTDYNDYNYSDSYIGSAGYAAHPRVLTREDWLDPMYNITRDGVNPYESQIQRTAYDYQIVYDWVIAAGVYDGMDAADAAGAIARYIEANASYDYNYNNDSFYMYGALDHGLLVCQGYALLYFAMCETAGIECQEVVGYVDAGSHMWNYVNLGNLGWQYIDVCWDDITGKYWFSSNGWSDHYNITYYLNVFSFDTRD